MKNMISTFKQQVLATAMGGKKELGFPGYTSRSGLQLPTMFCHFLKGKSANDREKSATLRNRQSKPTLCMLNYHGIASLLHFYFTSDLLDII